MDWKSFLDEFAQNPLFHSSMLSIFPDAKQHIPVQLSRWVKAGKLIQVRRGWYLIAAPYRSQEIPLPVIANRVVHPSYLSLDWALHYYDLIPEHVPNPTSVTSGRGSRLLFRDNMLIYYHIQPSFFNGYEQREYNGYAMTVALPEKALLDKIYLFSQSASFTREWLEELRLQNLEQLDLQLFRALAGKIGRKGWQKILELTVNYLKEQVP